jgi:hypothetical protein
MGRIMDLVIDTNCLNSPRLREFLSASRANRAVLTHETAVESFRGDVPDGIVQSWATLRDFPNQVIMLKAPRLIAPIDCSSPGMAKIMVDKGQTAGVKTFSRVLDEASAGNRVRIAQLQQRHDWSRDHTNRMIAETIPASSQIEEISSAFSEDEISRIRKQQALKESTVATIFEIVDSMAANAIYDGPIKVRPPLHHHRVNHFLWRRALVHAIYLLQLIERGAVQRADGKVRNDTIDALLSTYATYFGGIMTSDRMPEVLHLEARHMLLAVGARIPKS